MSRLVAVFAAEPFALAPTVDPLALCLDPAHFAGLGTAHATDDAVLLRKRPAGRQAEQVAIHLGGTTTKAAIVRLYGPSEGPTAPLRFGPWMFSWLGTLPADAVGLAERIAALPGSLRRNIKRPTAAAVLFAEILAGLSRRGVKKRYWAPPANLLVDAIREALDVWCGRFGKPQGAFVLQTSERAHLVHLGRALWSRADQPPGQWVFDSEPTPDATPLEAGEVLILGDPSGVQRISL